MNDRFHVKFTPASRALLDALAGDMGTTRAGALGLCMAFAARVLREQKQGNAVGVLRGDRVVKELSPPWGEFVAAGSDLEPAGK